MTVAFTLSLQKRSVSLAFPDAQRQFREREGRKNRDLLVVYFLYLIRVIDRKLRRRVVFRWILRSVEGTPAERGGGGAVPCPASLSGRPLLPFLPSRRGARVPKAAGGCLRGRAGGNGLAPLLKWAERNSLKEQRIVWGNKDMPFSPKCRHRESWVLSGTISH